MSKPRVIFRTADQLRDADASAGDVLREAESVRARIEYLQRADGAPSDAEAAEIRGLTKTLDGLLNLVDDMTVVDRRGVVPDGGILMDGGGSGRRAFVGGGGEYRDGVPLTERQSVAGFVRSRGL